MSDKTTGWLKLLGTAVIIGAAYIFIAPKLGKLDPFDLAAAEGVDPEALEDAAPQVMPDGTVVPGDVGQSSLGGNFPSAFQGGYDDYAVSNMATLDSTIVPSIYPHGFRLSGAY